MLTRRAGVVAVLALAVIVPWLAALVIAAGRWAWPHFAAGDGVPFLLVMSAGAVIVLWGMGDPAARTLRRRGRALAAEVSRDLGEVRARRALEATLARGWDPEARSRRGGGRS